MKKIIFYILFAIIFLPLSVFAVNRFGVFLEVQGDVACADTLDNDGDGKIDFPDDTGCDSINDTSEDGEVEVEEIEETVSGGGTPFIENNSELKIFGNSYPNRKIFLLLNGQKIKETVANGEGKFSFLLENSPEGKNQLLLYAVDEFEERSNLFSIFFDQSFGSAAEFRNINIEFKKDNKSNDFRLKVDLNKDGFVNLIDLSIFVYWYRNQNLVKSREFDINGDGLLSLQDVSIMLSYWTG